ncbi:zinc finger protein 726-like isoform X2 [Phymastichus coffea]|nr:zinc finger protein 726-like isoform X2 [Phymastichus coffea]
MKEEKVDYDPDALSTTQTSALSLTNPPALHLGPLLTPGANDTISIVIPLSAQLASLSRNAAFQQQMMVNCKQENVDITEKKPDIPKKPKPTPVRIKEDKTKGCPYPNCSRYGRAFSRAHDLKRHIARHEARENKTPEVQPPTQQHHHHHHHHHHQPPPQQHHHHQQLVWPCLVCSAHFFSEAMLQKHRLIHENADTSISSTSGPPYTCNFCKRTFPEEGLLNAHLPSHIKSEPLLAAFQQPPTSAAAAAATAQRLLLPNGPPPPLATPSMVSASSIATGDDDYRLEDMLLIRKGPGKSLASTSSASNSSSSPGKIRCEYCSKTFKTKWTLSSHVAAHEGRFQYQCCICSKRFVRKSHYESHVRSHDAARPYVCEHCGKTFKESKHRREHLKRKHPTNRTAIQSLLDSISACVNEDAAAAAAEQAKLTILMPMNFST